MKRNLFLLLFFFTQSSSAQNLLGASKEFIIGNILARQKHPQVTEDDGIIIVSYNKDDCSFNYFTKNDTCFMYAITGPYSRLTEYVAYLNKEFEKVNDEEWIQYERDFKIKYELIRAKKDWGISVTREKYQ